MIGLSLSFCIFEICRGLVSVSDVEKIIAGTINRNKADWEFTIKEYKRLHWYAFPEQAQVIVRELLAEGKIEQPRLTNDSRYPLIEDGKWVKSEMDIKWSPSHP